jgi:hypothetical protein
VLSPKNFGTLKVTSDGRVEIAGTVLDLQSSDKHPDDTFALTVIQLESAQKAPKWIYILSFIVGLFLLACISYGLYHVCYFKFYSKGRVEGLDNF